MSLQKGFFFVQSSNPVLPPEEWELVYENTTAGDYNISLGWGKYKFEICGGGGSGAALTGSYYHTNAVDQATVTRKLTATSGYAGYIETGAFSVLYGKTSLISGKIGDGGKGAYSMCDAQTQNHTETPGASGSGALSGVSGAGNSAYNVWRSQQSNYTHIMVSGVSGSGGGSSSILQDNLIISNAKGGRGADITEAWLQAYRTTSDIVRAQINSVYGGKGGDSGTTAGTGNNGGNSTINYGGGRTFTTITATGNNGGAGYIRIYKSNLKPEPL